MSDPHLSQTHVHSLAFSRLHSTNQVTLKNKLKNNINKTWCYGKLHRRTLGNTQSASIYAHVVHHYNIASIISHVLVHYNFRC